MTSLVNIVTSFAVGVTTAIVLRSSFGRLFALGSQFRHEDTHGTKLAIVIRTDLKMGKGKCCSQCAHAAVSCYKKALMRNPRLLKNWENEGEPKVVLKADTPGENTLYELAKEAQINELVTVVIRDAGRTQIESGSVTVLGIGPGNAATIDKIVGHLKLF